MTAVELTYAEGDGSYSFEMSLETKGDRGGHLYAVS